MKHLLKLDDEAMRMLGFLRLMEGLTKPEDIKAVLDIIGKDNRGGMRMTEQAMLLQKWAKIAPADAASYANSQRDWSKFNGLNAVLKTWVKDSPEEAIAWAEKNGVQTDENGQPALGRGHAREFPFQDQPRSRDAGRRDAALQPRPRPHGGYPRERAHLPARQRRCP